MLRCFSYVRLFATLWTVACWAFLSSKFSRQEYWSGFPFSSPGDFPDPGIELEFPAAPALHADSLPLPSHWGSPNQGIMLIHLTILKVRTSFIKRYNEERERICHRMAEDSHEHSVHNNSLSCMFISFMYISVCFCTHKSK